jgi:hypothetical protein
MVAYNDDDSMGKKALLLLLGPFIGLAYVIALPFISIATMVVLLSRKIVGAIFNLLGNLVSFGWRPGEAYLGGKKKKKDSKKGKYPDDT